MKKSFTFFCLILLPLSSPAVVLLTGQESLEFHGYYRGGLGMSEHAATQVKFQAPGARAKYRLGNEPETNMELKLVYNYDIPEQTQTDAHIQAVIMLDGFKNHGDSADFTVSNLAQGYLTFSQFFNNDINVWLGRRYYDRKSIHILNHYWLNTGQNAHTGLGVENINAGYGSIDLAIFRHEDKDDANALDNTKTTLINNTALDLRWRDLNISKTSKLTLWAQYANRSKQLNLTGVDEENGSGTGFWIDTQSANIKNTFALIYQTGAAITQADFNPRPVRESQGWDLNHASVIELNNSLTYESLPDISLQWAVVYRKEKHDQTTNTDINWYSTGIRPIFYFSRHINLAFEAGIDHVDDEINDRKGNLKKLTTALQISAARGFKSRPVLRLFVTLAEWDDDFIGLVTVINSPEGTPYGNDNNGWTAGAQLEAWW